MKQDLSTAELVQQGEMQQNPWLLSVAEYEQWECERQEKAQQRLFAIGQPLVYEKDGRMIAQFADGTVTSLH